MSLVKELYKVKSIHQAFYKGGDVEISGDGKWLYCTCGSSIQVVDVESGRACERLGDEATDEEEGDTVLAFTLTPGGGVVSSHRSSLLTHWTRDEKTVRRGKQWKNLHRGPVVKLRVTSDQRTLATGGTDSSIRLWDLAHGACSHNLTQAQGVISLLEFDERENGDVLLFGAGDDVAIRCWDCRTGEVVLTLTGHYSTVTAIAFHSHRKYIASCSRDKVLIVWDGESGKQVKVVPLYESVEGLVALPDRICLPGHDIKLEEGFYLATGGDTGVVRVWDGERGALLYTQTESLVSPASEGALAITRLLYSPALSALVVVSADHNIVFHQLDTFECTRQLAGFSDEVLSIALVGKEEEWLAVATNSPDIKLYRLANMSCSLLKGHTRLVLCLATTPANPAVFASSAKDHSVRVWVVGEGGAHCVAAGTRHTDTVTSVALAVTSTRFAVSVSEDTTLKLWTLPKKISYKMGVEAGTISVKQTTVAHEKEINDVSVSPNDRIVATASLDKTAKLWKSDDLSPLGTLRGHRRGVWCVRFSPVDQVLLTTSADSTLRLWSITDLSCLKTLEGHDSSVLCSEFLSRGTQVVSCGGDGLLKLWSIKSGECVASLDQHHGKIWSLVVSGDESTLYSGGSDSRLVVWQDWSQEAREERTRAEQEVALASQRLANLLQAGQLLEAIEYAISLNRPATTLKIIKGVVEGGGDGLEAALLGLSTEDKATLLGYAAHWNSNGKHCYVAQLIVSGLLEEVRSGRVQVPQAVLEALLPYTERHLDRLTRLTRDLHFLTYVRHQINPLASH